MILYLPAALFFLGLIGAYRATGTRRQAATVVMAVATAFALALLIDPSAASWGGGCVVASLMLTRARERMPLTFEGLSRRTLTIAAMLLLALFLAAQLPVGENPLFLTAVPWFLGAVGGAWVLNPIDAREHAQGQVFMVAAVAALILVAGPTGTTTAAVAGAAAIVPILSERGWLRPSWRPLLSSLLLLLAAAAAALALTGVTVPRQNVGDLGFSVAGPVLLGAAVVLAAGALAAPLGSEWTGVLAVLSLVTVAPAVRWAAIAALIAVASARQPAGERPAWLGLAAFAAVPVLQGLAPQAWSVRVQSVALGAGLVLMLYASRGALLRAIVLPATGFLTLLLMSSLSTSNLTRMQWIAAAGALLLIVRALLIRAQRESRPGPPTRDALVMGLLLLAITARDALGLGALAVALLLTDLALVEREYPIEVRSAPWARVTLLARSNWPPSISFAGASLAVTAALQASLALGLLAALMLAGLQLTPLLDRRAFEPVVERPASGWQWVGAALSLACGTAPALVLRMLRL